MLNCLDYRCRYLGSVGVTVYPNVSGCRVNYRYEIVVVVCVNGLYGSAYIRREAATSGSGVCGSPVGSGCRFPIDAATADDLCTVVG